MFPRHVTCSQAIGFLIRTRASLYSASAHPRPSLLPPRGSPGNRSRRVRPSRPTACLPPRRDHQILSDERRLAACNHVYRAGVGTSIGRQARAARTVDSRCESARAVDLDLPLEPEAASTPRIGTCNDASGRNRSDPPDWHSRYHVRSQRRAVGPSRAESDLLALAASIDLEREHRPRRREGTPLPVALDPASHVIFPRVDVLAATARNAIDPAPVPEGIRAGTCGDLEPAIEQRVPQPVLGSASPYGSTSSVLSPPIAAVTTLSLAPRCIFRLIVNTVHARQNMHPSECWCLVRLVCGGEASICWKLWMQDRGAVADATRACAMEATSTQRPPLRVGGRSIALPRLTRAHRKTCSLERIPYCTRCGRTSTLGSPRHVPSRSGHPAPQHEPRVPPGSAHQLSPFKRYVLFELLILASV